MRSRLALNLSVALAGIVAAYCVGQLRGERSGATGDAGAEADIGGTVHAAAPVPARAARHTVAALPPRGAPLKAVFPQLQARADAGDVAAATRLYRDLRLCYQLEGLDWVFSRADDALLDLKVDAADGRAVEDYRVQLDAIEQRRAILQKYHRLCDGLGSDRMASQLPSLQTAAELGEPLARACYLQRGPDYDPRALTRHPEWLAAYRSNVNTMIDAGLKAGDWRVVDVVRNAYEPGADGMLAGVLGSDPAMHYRYLKLYGLGAAGGGGAELGQQLAAAAHGLTPEQRMDADSWAQTQFQQRFGASDLAESAPSGWDPCSFPYAPL